MFLKVILYFKGIKFGFGWDISKTTNCLLGTTEEIFEYPITFGIRIVELFIAGLLSVIIFCIFFGILRDLLIVVGYCSKYAGILDVMYFTMVTFGI